MKKILIAAVMLFSVCAVSGQYTKKGNDYVTGSSSRAQRDTVVTAFTWNGDKIIVAKNDGYAWVGKVSGKSGKFYRKPVPEDIAKDVCKQIGIQYTHVKKQRK